MTNLINKLNDKLNDKFAKEIKSFGISEIFVINGELHTTSNYDLPFELISLLEKEVIA